MTDRGNDEASGSGSSSGRVGAAVDVGSNSVHLLVAAIEDHELRPLLDVSAFLGLGAAIDARAHLGPVAREELAGTLAGYADAARELGATTITLVGTEPIRRAGDAGSIVDAVERETGVPLHVLTHEEEAFLTLVGVTGGRPVGHGTLVVDIGGGSSEFCAVAPGERARAAGLRLGSERLTARFVRHDPPTLDEVAAMTRAAEEAMRAAFDADPAEVVAVGGTASNLLKATPGGKLDPVLTEGRLAGALAALLEQPAEETVVRFAVKPIRARLLPAGAAIVGALMRRYGVTEVRVSEAGMREGAVLIADHAGRGWRDGLEHLAHGWRT